ncbi:MAG TPA: O-antigen ligase family protein [Solirubrobacterales bacterium]|nr:O-antigen ligase family protein [Solirubrobacterales bacterium]
MVAGLRRLLSPSPRAERGGTGLPVPVRWGMLALLGFGCGLSPAFFGYFDLSAWGPLALILIALAIGLVLTRPALPKGLAGLALAALFLFAIWLLLSMGWAESADRALTEGDRWLLYGVLLLVLLLLLEERRDGEVFVASAAVGVLGVAAYDLARMLGSDGQSLFEGSRLLEPLGYVNGLGGFFLLGFWPLVALAERTRLPALAGAAAGGASLLAALVLLTESRGTVFAFAASAFLLLLLVPGRNRRAWILLTVLAGLAVAWGPLTDVTQTLPPNRLAPPEDAIRLAAERSLLVAAAVGVIWALASWAVAAARGGSRGLAANLPRISAALLAGVAVIAVATVAVAVKDPVGKFSDQYNAFTELKPTDGSSRFTSGGGNRYDYWRIAWNQFSDHPIEGIGAGNFDRTYFLERRTKEDVRQAHSIEFQTLGDTGLIGAALLGAFLVAVFVGAWRRSREARTDKSGVGLTVAAIGIFVVWLAQTSVDWLHLIPGLTGIALGAAAILLLSLRPRQDPAADLLHIPTPAVVVALALAVVAIVFIGRPTLAQHLRSEAQDEVATSPMAALDTVEESLSLNPESVQAYYTKASALARLDAYRPARAALLEAIRREPHNYVSWALLGDLTTRRGDISAAMRAYRKAASLNPRDVELRLLGSRPALVRQLHRNPGSVTPLEAATAG